MIHIADGTEAGLGQMLQAARRESFLGVDALHASWTASSNSDVSDSQRSPVRAALASKPYAGSELLPLQADGQLNSCQKFSSAHCLTPRIFIPVNPVSVEEIIPAPFDSPHCVEPLMDICSEHSSWC